MAAFTLTGNALSNIIFSGIDLLFRYWLNTSFCSPESNWHIESLQTANHRWSYKMIIVKHAWLD